MWHPRIRLEPFAMWMGDESILLARALVKDYDTFPFKLVLTGNSG